jgi:glycosyltransferase involved in cell wall biosynthesis
MISVCIATYNGEKYIKKQIVSILVQLAPDDEVVISDDNSTDDTLKEIFSIHDDRIKIINLKREKKGLNNHMLVSSNFENAIKNSRGDFIFLSDQDDIWAPDKVNEFMKYLGDYDLVNSDCCYIINDKIEYDTSQFKGKTPYRNLLITRPKYHGCCLAVTRKIIDVAIPFPGRLALHDGWLGLISENIGKVKFLDKRLTYYRIHNDSVSQVKKNHLFYQVTYRLNIYFALIGRLMSYKLKTIFNK